MESLLGVLGQLAADMRSDSARRALLDAAWPAAVGERLRRHSRVASSAHTASLPIWFIHPLPTLAG